jgi:hypothetical protein
MNPHRAQPHAAADTRPALARLLAALAALVRLATLAAVSCTRAPSASSAPAASVDADTNSSQSVATPVGVSPPPPASIGAFGASLAFCAFGGQGVLGADARFEDFIRVVAVIDVTAPPPAVTAASTPGHVDVAAVELRNDEGVVEASMRALVDVTRVDPIPPTTTWETALRRGAPFDGTLRPGLSRLRVEAWLTTRPRSHPLRARVVLTAPTGPVVADGPVLGEWPTG